MSANESQIFAKYDEFQSEAVENIVADYSEKINGRYLLVIPTGGGKTYTAVKAINRLFHDQILNPDSDLVVWGAHREELVKQAKDTFTKFAKDYPDLSFIDNVKVMGIAGVRGYVSSNKDVKIVVIDEAHHAALNNIQYGPIFDYPTLGILGLTATPSRHDGEPLEFDKESYSIGFPDLVEKQIILSPEIRTITGGHFAGVKASGATGFTGLESLNSEERDQAIIKHIDNYSHDYQKIIVYASSVKHARELRERMLKSNLSSAYESIDCFTGEYITGGDDDRESFVKRIKAYQRAIIINFDVLTEGYDDPKVNTILMARPTRSKLVYMQAAGRCARINPDDLSKRAFIVEVVDELPNIRYRINNRWLFSEISDTLEPAVEDKFFGSAEEFESIVNQIFESNSVNKEDRVIPAWDKRMRYGMLLFRSYTGLDNDGNPNFRHIPLLIDNVNRASVSNWFNFLSERMEKLIRKDINPIEAMNAARVERIDAIKDELTRRLIFDAMEEASKVACSPFDSSNPVLPWIKFVALRFRRTGLPEDVEEFIKDMVNKEAVEEAIRTLSYEPPSRLVRFPLPLTKYVGVFLTAEEFKRLKEIVDDLEAIKIESGTYDHRYQVRDLLGSAVLPVAPMYTELLPAMVREERGYYIELE